MTITELIDTLTNLRDHTGNPDMPVCVGWVYGGVDDVVNDVDSITVRPICHGSKPVEDTVVLGNHEYTECV